MARRGRRSTAGAVVILIAIATSLSGCGVLDAANKASQSQESQQPTSAPSPSDLKVPLYWVGQTSNSSYLFREYSNYQAEDAAPSGDIVSTTIAMLSKTHPRDGDYHSAWKPASRVGSSMSATGTLTVDVSPDMFNMTATPTEARMAIQQLIYTATAAAAVAGIGKAGPDTKVVILVDGRRGFTFGGQTLGSPMTRDKAAAAPLWIIDPSQDEQTTSTFSVKMVASNIASKVYWDIKTNDDVVASGEENLSEQDGGLQEIQFSKSLPTGKYTIRMYIRTEDLRDPSFAVKGHDISITDDHTFTVKGR